MPKSEKDFYEREYANDIYAPIEVAEEHGAYAKLKELIGKYGLGTQSCLEVGCGRGQFQDLVENYVGLDLAEEVRKHIHKPFYAASAKEMPFKDNDFGGAWSIWVLEHIPNPEKALSEIRRVLKNGGILILWPAWQCTPWAAQGYPVRPYSDFKLKGKIVKFSIFFRKRILFRMLKIMPRRIFYELQLYIKKKPIRFNYKPLNANYEHFWMSDSDAVNSMDPHTAILWFVSRGDQCLNYDGILSRLSVRTGPVVLRINKS